ncbi:type VII secretion protein EccE [Micromonospora inyonensis]|uniref:Type VII secretion protein EccE n=1 Tax=Micromonospora inyonensis TaxID=47866 RepID=A0A1C6RP10_9ACTN|nr:type VII secretion protein EccE [Micromonospora inyonensis]SCL18946.1 type VII secretion protein EccE [Micromonospora inyonensis]
MTQVEAARGRTVVARADRPRRGRLGPVTVGQLVVLEVGALTVGAVSQGQVWVTGAVAALVLLVVLATFARRGGRWWYEDRALRRRLRRRERAARRAALSPATADPRLSALAPDLTVTGFEDRGNRLGLGQDDQGWFVACVVTVPGGTAGPLPGAAIDQVVRVLAGSTGPASSTQVVARSLVWYPNPGRPAAYRRDVWVAARLRVADARTEAVNRGGGIDGVRRTLAAAAGRIGKALTGAGLAYRMLDPDELTAALLTAAGLDVAPDSQVESWTGLAGRGWTQRCLELRGRPDAPVGALADAVTAIPVMSHTLSVTINSGGRAGVPLLRVASPDSRADDLLKTVQDVARRHSFVSRQLDGWHGPAAYACAPVAVADTATGSVALVTG